MIFIKDAPETHRCRKKNAVQGYEVEGIFSMERIERREGNASVV
jgi:hypothetical protein